MSSATESILTAIRFWGPLAYLTPPVIMFCLPLAAGLLLWAAKRFGAAKHGLTSADKLVNLAIPWIPVVIIVGAGMCIFPGPMTPFILSDPIGGQGAPPFAAADWWAMGSLGLAFIALCYYARAVLNVGRDYVQERRQVS